MLYAVAAYLMKIFSELKGDMDSVISAYIWYYLLKTERNATLMGYGYHKLYINANVVGFSDHCF